MPDEIANQDRPPIYIPSEGAALRQGEIISDLIQTNRAVGGRANEIDLVRHPYAIVISQDCDLDWDFRVQKGEPKKGKNVPDILFCQAQLAVEIREQEYINTKKWNDIQGNQNERYQFLEKVPAESDSEGIGIGELTVDFKRCFSLPTADVYDQTGRSENFFAEAGEPAKRRCRLISPYDLHLCHRIAFYQSRVALPGIHDSEKLQG